MKETKDNKQMEKYTMFLDWKNQCCENDYTTQSNLQIQCNFYQTTNGFVTELLFVWKHKRPQTAKAILKKKTDLEELTFLTSDYTTKLQSPRQHSTGTKQKCRQKEQDRKPRYKPTHLIFDKGGKNIQWRK